MRVGHGYDSHRLVSGRPLVLGGFTVPHDQGLAGHSDADVLTHAVIDALLGALGRGDIGTHFPDTDERWRGARSVGLLREIVSGAEADGYAIRWIDCTIVAEAPRIGPHVAAIRESLREGGLDPDRINLKAKTAEGMGPVGRREGIEAYAVCLLERRDENREKARTG
jgi:2-C-methyl-D-erythritol 2,4-cyclodiphosphate synthase